MAKTLARNVSPSAFTFPLPYVGALAPGALGVLGEAPSVVAGRLGNTTGVLLLSEEADTEATTIPIVTGANLPDGLIGYADLADSVIDGHKVKPAVNLEAHGTPHLVFIFPIPDAASADYDIVLDHGIEVFDVTVRKEGADGGAANTVTLKKGATAITDVMSINVADKSQVYPGTIDDAQAVLAAGNTLRVSVVKAGGNAACKVFVSAIKR